MATNRWTGGVLAGAGALALMVSLSNVWVAAEEKPAEAKPVHAKVGEKAPDFELMGIDGKARKLSDFKGQIVVLHFQSATCPWEHAYQAYFNAVAKKYGKPEQKEGEVASMNASAAEAQEGQKQLYVQFLGINANHNENAEQLRAYAKSRDIKYPILKDEGNKIADVYQARHTPHIYIIDADGVLRYMGGVEKVPTSVSQATKMEEQYLEPGLVALLAGEELKHTETTSKGCTIKRVRR